MLLSVLWCFWGARGCSWGALGELLGSLRVLLGCSWVLFGALGVLLGWFWGALEVLEACSFGCSPNILLVILDAFGMLLGARGGAPGCFARACWVVR